MGFCFLHVPISPYYSNSSFIFFSFLSHLKSEFPSIDGDRSMLRDKKNVRIWIYCDSGRGYLPNQKPAQLHTRGIAPTRSCSKTRMQASKDVPTTRQIPRSGFSSTKKSETNQAQTFPESWEQYLAKDWENARVLATGPAHAGGVGFRKISRRSWPHRSTTLKRDPRITAHREWGYLGPTARIGMRQGPCFDPPSPRVK